MKVAYIVTVKDKKQIAILGTYSTDPNKSRVPSVINKRASVDVSRVELPILKGESLNSQNAKKKVKEAVFKLNPTLDVVDARTHNAFLDVESDNIDTYVAIKIVKGRIAFVTLSNSPIKREGVKNILVNHECGNSTESIIKAAANKLGQKIWWSKQSKFIG